jgi:hypothetical protein
LELNQPYPVKETDYEPVEQPLLHPAISFYCLYIL